MDYECWMYDIFHSAVLAYTFKTKSVCGVGGSINVIITDDDDDDDDGWYMIYDWCMMMDDGWWMYNVWWWSMMDDGCWIYDIDNDRW